MEYLANIGVAIVVISLIATYFSFAVSIQSEKTHRRLRNRKQRDANSKNISRLKIQIELLEQRIKILEERNSK